MPRQAASPPPLSPFHSVVHLFSSSFSFNHEIDLNTLPLMAQVLSLIAKLYLPCWSL